MNKIQEIQIVMDALMDKYSDRVPDVKKIINAMIAKGIIDSADDIANDHIAFRTLGVPQLGIQSLEKIVECCLSFAKVSGYLESSLLITKSLKKK